ncbi:FixH family protein [Fredinandcohnia humi]
MKKIGIFLLIGIFIGLVGCNTTTEKNGEEPIELIPIAVEVEINPTTVTLEEEVTIEATVTQGDEAVEDADEVKFEIKEKGVDESEFLEGAHQADGVYSIKKTFEKDGIYEITAHVTARSMHNMPTIEVTVGNPNVDEEQSTNTDTTEGSHSHEHGHHGNGQVSIELQVDEEYTKGVESTLTALLEEVDVPLTHANVRFEIWKDQAEKHEFIDATEVEDGVYEKSYTFTETGKYHIQIHVEKGDIHEHLSKTVTVK